MKIKEIEKDIEEIAGLEDYEDLPVEGGIFDEDLESDEDFEDFEMVDEEAPVSDFDIGSTLLTAAAPVESWAGQNLEDELSREWIKKDWDDSDDAFSGDFYKSSDEKRDVYGAKGKDAYSSGDRGGGAYVESGGAYDTKAGIYDIKGGDVGALKSHEQVQDERRGGRSLLESGFEDTRKRESRAFNRESVTYEAGKAM